MKQQTISDVEYSARKRKTKREEFLEIMDEIIPCVVPQLQSLHAGTCRTVFQKTRDRLIRGDYALWASRSGLQGIRIPKRLWKGCFRVQICQL